MVVYVRHKADTLYYKAALREYLGDKTLIIDPEFKHTFTQYTSLVVHLF